MIETIIAYIVIFAPSLLSILGIILGVFKNIRNANQTTATINCIKEEALNTFTTIKDSKELADLYKLIKEVVSENAILKQQLIECTEALTRIRNKHPELFSTNKEG